ncbi:hypothetical protein OKW35_005229 [Paraburkholderia sp. MM5477-R1]
MSTGGRQDRQVSQFIEFALTEAVLDRGIKLSIDGTGA